MLEILGVSKSGYYAWLNRKPSERSLQKTAVIEAIKKIYEDSKCIYGAPKITAELHKAGFKTAESTVTKYMREIGIKACWVKPYTVTTHSEDFSDKLKKHPQTRFLSGSSKCCMVYRYHIYPYQKRFCISFLHHGSVLKKDRFLGTSTYT